MVSFGQSHALWLLLLPALAAVAAVLRHQQRLDQQRRLASPAVWDRLLGGAPATGLLRLLAWSAAAALVALAVARPQWGELPGEISVRTRDLVVALDVSDSMLCPDLPPTRLHRSLELVHRALPGLEGNRLGVVVFAGDAYPLVPLTTDLQAAASFIDAIQPSMVALPGSNIERALAAALDLMPEEGEGRVVVLITDGENLQGDVEAAAAAARAAGVGVLAVVAGTAEGGPIPVLGEDGKLTYKRDQNGQPVVTRAQRQVLDELCGATDGEVIELAAGSARQELLEAVARIRTREVEITRKVQLVERFPLFLAAAAGFLLISFGLSPWRRRLVAALLVAGLLPLPAFAQVALPAPSGAAAAPDPAAAPAGEESTEVLQVPWWQRLIPGGSRRLARSGARAWRAGEHLDAAKAFAGAAALDPEDPERLFDLGTALAAGGQLETGAALLGAADEGGVAGAAYNVGTASLQQNQAEMAVQWLRKALIDNPDDAEVKRNYELALRLLEQQEEQEQEQEQEQDQEDQEDQEEQEQQEEEGEPTPTPTPSPSSGSGAQPTPTPTPDPSSAIYAALERAENEAREAMKPPTPQAATVEKDW